MDQSGAVWGAMGVAMPGLKLSQRWTTWGPNGGARSPAGSCPGRCEAVGGGRSFSEFQVFRFPESRRPESYVERQKPTRSRHLELKYRGLLRARFECILMFARISRTS